MSGARGGDVAPGGGCESCRRGVLRKGDAMPRALAARDAGKTLLFRCELCGAWWEERDGAPALIGEAQARAGFPRYFALGLHRLETLQGPILAAVLAAEAAGARVACVVDGPQGLLVQMQDPLTPRMRKALLAKLTDLRHFRSAPPARDPGEGFRDEAGRAAVTFPLHP